MFPKAFQTYGELKIRFPKDFVLVLRFVIDMINI